MNAIIGIFGMILGLFGMGTSAVTQVQTYQNRPRPPQQVQNYRCPDGTSQPRLVGPLADGSYQVECEQQP